MNDCQRQINAERKFSFMGVYATIEKLICSVTRHETESHVVKNLNSSATKTCVQF